MTTIMPPTPWPEHESRVMGEIEGRPVTLHFGDPATEYASLRRGAMVIDRSHRHRLQMSGAAAPETLAGLLTNDIKALAPGQGQYAAALTPKGKIVADLRVLAHEDTVFTIDTSRRAAAGWMQVVRKFVNPRATGFVDQSDATGTVGVYGARAMQLVAELLGGGLDIPTLTALAPYGHLPFTIEGAPSTLVRTPELVLDGYEMFVPADATEALVRRLAEAGATPGGLLAWEIARIEAGRPEWGLDIDENTLPQEANFDELHAISYTKGCYTGQETVARVHFRGHVNRHLRGFRCGAPDPIPPHAQLYDEAGKLVGDVRSTAVSPRIGGIGLAMIRREVAIGALLAAQWEGGASPVTVAELPLL